MQAALGFYSWKWSSLNCASVHNTVQILVYAQSIAVTTVMWWTAVLHVALALVLLQNSSKQLIIIFILDYLASIHVLELAMSYYGSSLLATIHDCRCSADVPQ